MQATLPTQRRPPLRSCLGFGMYMYMSVLCVCVCVCVCVRACVCVCVSFRVHLCIYACVSMTCGHSLHSDADVPPVTEPQLNSVVITTSLSSSCSVNTSVLPAPVNISLYHEVCMYCVYMYVQDKDGCIHVQYIMYVCVLESSMKRIRSVPA